MKKYYDLIVSLIKTNRRYLGCEDILDDIVNEVYAQAEIVLNDVTNENVITSYLNKVVTTSIIKVSRQAGIKTHNSNVAGVAISPVFTRIVTAENNEDVLAKQSDLVEEAEQELDEEIESNDINEDIETEEPLADDAVAESDIFEIENQEEIKKTEPDVDKALVDKMINGVKNEESVSPLVISNEETENILVDEESKSEFDVIPEDLPDMSISDTEEELSAETEETLELEITENNIEEINIADQSEDVLIESEESNTLDVDQEELLVLDEAETADDLLMENNIEEISDLNQENSAIDEVTPLNEASDVLKIDEEDVLTLSAENEVENVAENIESNDIDFREPSYDYFKYSPKEYKIDYNEISSEVQELGTKYSDLSASEVIRLKYQEKLSIDEIASKLETTDKAVLDVLNELVNIVKD